MTSEARCQANRRNATKSTGPRTSEGKTRSRRNALTHGLAVPRLGGPEIELWAQRFHDEDGDPARREQAWIAAESQVEVERVRQVTLELLSHAAQRLACDASLTDEERTALAFARQAKTLASCDRYERRALARRNKALRKLSR